MYSLEENGYLEKPNPTLDYVPRLLTQKLADFNVFADPCISSALFSRRAVRGMNTLNPYGAGTLKGTEMRVPVQHSFSGVLYRVV